MRKRLRTSSLYSSSSVVLRVVMGAALPADVGRVNAHIMVEAGHWATLTTLGRDVLSTSGKSASSRVTAFLNVELFKVMYDQYKGSALPPPPAIERQVTELGVSPKQKERARQTFMKSAQCAGFIDATTGRFVKPGVVQADTVKEEKPPREKGGGNDGDGTDGLNFDPLLIELLKKIPETEKGWPGRATASLVQDVRNERLSNLRRR